MNIRAASIAAALTAMRRLGVNQIIDFTIKVNLPVELTEHIVQAAMLMDQDRWVLHFPVVRAKEGTPVVLDELTVIRSGPEPVVGTEDQGESTAESLPEEILDEENSEPEVDLILAEQIIKGIPPFLGSQY